MAAKGPVLAAFDLPLGVPESYLTAAAAIPAWRCPSSFLELLPCACRAPQFFLKTTDATQWKVERPFFGVPAGKSGLTRYMNAAAQKGVDLYRRIDRITGAKTVFAKSGIPGSVGSGACALWQELGPMLEGERTFRVWPFEGELSILLRSTAVILGEMYPRAAYATALLDCPAAARPALIVAKTKVQIRHAAIEALRNVEWTRVLGVKIENLSEAADNEDDFDACMTAAALLRCELEKISLCLPRLNSNRAEGGILGTGSVNLDLRARTFGARHGRGGELMISGARAKARRKCACNCDGLTRGGTWIPGHDAKFKSRVLRHLREGRTEKEAIELALADGAAGR